MSMSADTPCENLTLTEADLAACRPIVGEGGHVLRALCPFHGSDRQRSLRVQVHSGRFVCFACGAWGYMETARAQWREEQQRQAAFRRPAVAGSACHVSASHCLASDAAQHRHSTGTAGARSSAARPRAAARRVPGCPAGQPRRTVPAAAGHSAGPGAAVGVGYAAPGTWPHAARDWRGGRVVFPHTTPEGCLVNLYGRAVGTAEQVPKAKRHDHLPGAQGLLQRRGTAGWCWAAVGVRGRL